MEDPVDERRTVQLRRYAIIPGEMDAFLAWFRGRVVPARETFGFRVESALAVRETDEFVWAVSAPVDAAAFAELDAAWVASPERAAAFAGEPVRVASMDLRIAEPA